MRRPCFGPVALAYAAFALVGVNAGVNGVLLAAQMDDYAVSRVVLGITFFVGSAGFVLAGISAGVLVHRLGTRIALATGGSVFALAALYAGTRPPIVAFVGLQIASGYGVGVLESVLNAYLSTLPNATTLLNRLHGFFGVGALLGPPLATWIVAAASWPTVMLLLGAAAVPLTVGCLIVYPRAGSDPAASGPRSPAPGALTSRALRQPGVLLGAALLAVYVGLELSVGNWAFSYLVEARLQTEVLAGYAVSGYWLGLTAGRFLLGPLVTRVGLTAVGLMYICLVGVTVINALSWILPGRIAATAGLVPLGFFLGPIFPTAVALAPRVSTARLVPTSIGIMNAGSVVGGSAFPWLAGAIAAGAGLWTLLPFTLALSLLLLVIWWPTARRLAVHHEPPPDASNSAAHS